MTDLAPSSDLEKRIMEVMTSNPKGVLQSSLQASLPNVKVVELVQVLNLLIAKEKINLLKKGNQLVYVWKNENVSKKLQSTDVEEKLIFEAIKNAGNNGISARELKFACNMPQPQITKILKGLELRKHIKSVTSTTKKKVFMLFELEPSSEITGGVFYNDEEFDAVYVKAIEEQVYRYLLQTKAIAEKLLDPVSQMRASYKSSKEICDYINGLKISKDIVTLKDMERLLQSLVYDAKLKKNFSLSKGSEPENFYAVSKSLVSNVGLMRIPCGVCLVFQDCGRGLEVSPATCQYMKEWLDF